MLLATLSEVHGGGTNSTLAVCLEIFEAAAYAESASSIALAQIPGKPKPSRGEDALIQPRGIMLLTTQSESQRVNTLEVRSLSMR